MKRAHTLQEVVDAGYAPSVRWLRERLHRGEIPGIRVRPQGSGFEWRMTDSDIEQFLESRRNNYTPPRRELELAPTLNLTPAALRRRRAS